MKALILAILFVVSTALPAFTGVAGATMAVKAEGASNRTNDATEEKRLAIDKALKNAVTEALHAVVKAEGLELDKSLADKEILSSPRSYILNYKVVSEGWVTHMGPTPSIVESIPAERDAGGVELYHVWIEASVDDGAIRASLGKVMAGPALSDVFITVLDVTEYQAFSALLASLRRIALLNGLTYGSFQRGRVTLKARSAVGLPALSERISKEAPAGYLVLPNGPSTILIKAETKADH
ncbi:MAG: hypothetical protein HY955_00730 [Deltaproteobacteria bacterium]|nr:hypothetical protein [Deltaproteobacteria bacterium]